MMYRSAVCTVFALALFFSGGHTPRAAWGADDGKAGAEPSATAQNGKSKWSDDPKQLGVRIESVNTLIEKSSGARRIASAGNPEAVAMQDQARAFLHDAQSAQQKGNDAAAKDAVSKAVQAMSQAVRKADGGVTGATKQEDDFQRRLESVKVLLSAHERISKEKKQGEETSRRIQKSMDEAVGLKGSNVVAARTKLDEAYITAKLGIEQMRRGDTLVRSLHFDSKEEEYHYEVDRNDTHQMLVNMLLEGKSDDAKATAAKFVEKAKAVRQQAEQLAAKKQFERAVTAMEESTGELVRAIRSAGIFIPG